MSALAGGISYETVKFRNVGDSVAGRIIEFADVQERDFNTKEPKWFTSEGKVALGQDPLPGWNPVLQVRVTLETRPGDSASRMNLYVSGKRMRDAVKAALAAAGVNDISPQADIRVTFTGYDGAAKCYSAGYAPFDPNA